MSRPSVIIVGTGRSGTSFVAKICHEDLGICMGHYLREANLANPLGFYEDILSHGALQLAQDGVIGVKDYTSAVSKSHKDCALWGFKDPKVLYFPVRVLVGMAPKLIIRTWRPLKATVASWLKKDIILGRKLSGTSEEGYRNIILEREALMDDKLKYFNVLTVKMDKHVEASELIPAIRSALCLD